MKMTKVLIDGKQEIAVFFSFMDASVWLFSNDASWVWNLAKHNVTLAPYGEN
jgi:hypothetical protein